MAPVRWKLVLGMWLCFLLTAGSVLASSRQNPYVPAGAEWTYAAHLGPEPAVQIGRIAAVALSQSSNGAPLPRVLGPSEPGSWPTSTLEFAADADLGRAPFGVADSNGNCRCATALQPVPGRVVKLKVGRHFVVPSLSSLTGLRLRVRFQDSLEVHINGQRVLERNTQPNDDLAPAARPSGREWETQFVPLSPGLLRKGENIIVAEIRPSAKRQGPYFDLELAPVTSTGLVRGPLVQRVAARAATIVFETNGPSRGAISFRNGSGDAKAVVSAGGALAQRHVVALSGLDPEHPVDYQVIADGMPSSEYRFHLAPAPSKVIRFAVYGDVRNGHDTHHRIVQRVMSEAPDFVVTTGDQVMRGSDEGDWQRFFEISGPLLARTPYYPAAGNHDLGQSGEQRRRMNEIFALWPGPPNRPPWGNWYSFDVADVHVVMLDSNAYREPGQLSWLRGDLAAAKTRGVRAIFAVVHDGPYSRGLHRGNRFAAKHFVPLLIEHGVVGLFSGHDHLYQRGQISGLNYIVSGGGGAPLYRIRCGVRGRPRCRERDGMIHVSMEHHYLLVSVFREFAEVCAKRTDGSALEPCAKWHF